MRERYENLDNEQDIDQYEEGDKVGQQARQPSISDPKLWLVKCKMGKERECVENLFHKYFATTNDHERIK